jgi:lysophospholipid acyltransferase (LPLAT)-like uncharacterized protein
MSKASNRLVGPAGALIRLLASTYRFKVLNEEVIDAVYARGEAPIYACWHQRWMAPVAMRPRKAPLGIMVSQSRDGEFISRIIARMGWHVARGSSSRGGREALRALLGFLRSGVAVVHVVDGPRGPFGVIKPGLIALARMSGMPILLTAVSPERRWICNSWDRFMIPKPFTRVVAKVDAPVYAPRHMNEADAEALRKQLEGRLRVLYAEVDSLWRRGESGGQL